MKYDLAKLMKEKLMVNKDIFKFASSDDIPDLDREEFFILGEGLGYPYTVDSWDSIRHIDFTENLFGFESEDISEQEKRVIGMIAKSLSELNPEPINTWHQILILTLDEYDAEQFNLILLKIAKALEEENKFFDNIDIEERMYGQNRHTYRIYGREIEQKKDLYQATIRSNVEEDSAQVWTVFMIDDFWGRGEIETRIINEPAAIAGEDNWKVSYTEGMRMAEDIKNKAYNLDGEEYIITQNSHNYTITLEKKND